MFVLWKTPPSPVSWTAVGFDCLGNLASTQTYTGRPSGPVGFSLSVDGTINRISTGGFSYDANGNMTAKPSGNTMTYDPENRIATASLGGSTDTYEYGSGNERVYKKSPNGVEEVYFYAGFAETGDLHGE